MGRIPESRRPHGASSPLGLPHSDRQHSRTTSISHSRVQSALLPQLQGRLHSKKRLMRPPGSCYEFHHPPSCLEVHAKRSRGSLSRPQDRLVSSRCATPSNPKSFRMNVTSPSEPHRKHGTV